MDIGAAVEALDLLKANPSQISDPAPVGSSGSDFYESDAWTKRLWKYVLVGSHDYSKETGRLTNLVFHPIDVIKRAAMISNTFPGK